MSWDYRITDWAIKQLRKLGPEASRRVIAFLDERIKDSADPRQFGKALRGELGEFWRYRVGDYRVLCRIEDGEFVVLVVKVGHRSDVYD
ncbi:type II toxin-antitoxin system RelE/ParE family toxin [Pelagicoccus sp. NFK12]|uniref:Type II toxin-antitoxin system RelE/ParE family toxin n=1 Tax=Pelagicoccus enzymogenes TaxID=2773457 RepID=A0A927F9J0_9BACT|nr:type II toxin-antitoxin system RelE/ParE family toxin [Pelagicoccus enzymogenes]MBD5780983.1 type II toxin-antitoxin system RelE/ParE family toxin [Pelagicoccus enzymogenes]